MSIEDELYGVPLSTFTAERKRLASELPKEERAKILALPKPSVSAWVVNRLYREAGEDMAALLAAAEHMRKGNLEGATAQRAALARLRAKAADLLTSDGHAASEGTLRRVTTTLQALAAIGSFEPDAPGRLVADRDPPGFDLLGVTIPPRQKDAAAERARAEEKAAAELARAQKEKERLVAKAKQELEAREKEVSHLRDRLRSAEEQLHEARLRVRELER